MFCSRCGDTVSGLPSNVRVEYPNNLTPSAWELLTVITNLPSSPYPYICGREAGGGAQRFYRAVLAR